MKSLRGSRRQGRQRRRVLSIFRCFKRSTKAVFSSSSGKTSSFGVLPEIGEQQGLAILKDAQRDQSLEEDKSAGRRRCLVKRILLVLLTIIFLRDSAQATDSTRIGF